MFPNLLNAFVVGCYALAGAMLARRLFDAAGAAQGRAPLALGTLAAIAHAAIIGSGFAGPEGVNVGIEVAASIMGWIVVVLFLAATRVQPAENLGAVIFPAAACIVAVAWLVPSRAVPLPRISPALVAHLVVALLAYALLSLAVVQALFIAWQDARLRSHPRGPLRAALPPLQTMERLLFRMVAAGFALLSLTLVSGAFFAEELFGRPFVFTHHVVLSLFAWVVFAVLLVGHWRFGWRGRSAARWTVSGFALLMLAYFGSKFVIEVLLRR